MKICIVGPGIMPIPPNGWGAVEILIWDYKETLEKLGHNVNIINTKNFDEIISQCNDYNPDFVHVQYDEYWPICDYLNCKNVAITSHFGYLERPQFYGGYASILNGFLSMKKTKIFALSDGIANVYKNFGFDPNKIFVVPNGVRVDLFKFNELCKMPDKSIYLAKVTSRKRQHLVSHINSIDFIGNTDGSIPFEIPIIGEWDKNTLYNNLTNYSNLVLLSDGEAHPLVCLEAMCAGLGLVISEWAAANLDLDLPFIDVIPEFAINDRNYVANIIKENRKKSNNMRKEIREYAIKNFSWDKIVTEKYIPCILQQ